jgi:hypothetical protein
VSIISRGPARAGRKRRHVLSLSGGKDSAALAIYMRDKVSDIEYVFCDTGKELPETYEYLNLLEVALGKPITRLHHDDRCGFDELLAIRRNFLPSPQVRWCTEYLKIKPFEKYVGDDWVINYIGIRADEGHRKRYISTKPNIEGQYPFVEDGIRRHDVIRMLNETIVGGKPLGLPKYYRWRSRSGCYFCFFQQRREWIGLLENHPDLFSLAMAYEKNDSETGERYTWVQRESLAELSQPRRIEQIKQEYERRLQATRAARADASLGEVFGDSDEPGDTSSACIICHL